MANNELDRKWNELWSHNLRYYFSICLEGGLKEKNENLGQDSRTPSWDMDLKQQVFKFWSHEQSHSPLISHSFSVCDVTKQNWRLRSRKHFVCCSLRSMNQLFLFSEPSSDNFRAIPNLPTALGVHISSFRKRGAFEKGKKCRTSACDTRKCGTSETVFSSQSAEICAPCGSWMADVNYDCVKSVAKYTGNRLHLLQFLQSL
jgi:hypothetical protein